MKYYILIYFIITSLAFSQSEKIYEHINLQNILVDFALYYEVEIIVDQNLINKVTVSGRIDYTKELSFNLKKVLKGLKLDFKIENSIINIRYKPDPEYSLYGIISDEKNGEKVYYASVYLLGSKSGTSSNEDGFYSIGKIKNKKVKLVVSHVNYMNDTISLFLRKKNNRLNIKLKSYTYKENVREVLSNKSKLPTVVNEKSTKIKAGFSNSIANLIEPDLFRDMQRLPGIYPLRPYHTEFSIRSSSPGENLILMDGVELYAPFHLGGILSSFNLQGLREYEIYKDNVPAKYNDRLAGTLNILAKEGNKEQFEGNAQISLLTAAMSLEGPIANGAYFVALRRSYYDVLLGLSLPFYLYDLNTNIYQDVSTNDRISFKYYRSQDSVEEIAPLISEINFSNQLIKIDWRRILSSKLFGNLSVSFSEFDLKGSINDFFETNLNFNAVNNISNIVINADFDYLYKNVMINLGYRYKMLRSEFPSVSYNKLNIKDYKKSASYHKLYGESEYTFENRLKVSYGASLNFSEVYDRVTFQPKVYLNYETNVEGLNLFSGIRHNYQETFNTASQDSYSRYIVDRSFPDLPRLTQLTIGAYYQVDNSSAKFSLFKKWSRNLLSINNKIDSTYTGNFRLSDVFLGYDTNIIGSEIYYHYKYNRLESQISYTVIRAVELSESGENLFYLDRRHNFSFMLNYIMGNNWNFNSQIQVGSAFSIKNKDNNLVDSFAQNYRISKYFDESELYVQFHWILDKTDDINQSLISLGYKFSF